MFFYRDDVVMELRRMIAVELSKDYSLRTFPHGINLPKPLRIS
jgi:hypothetical protein